MSALPPSLVDEFDTLFCGLWPEQLRALFDPDNPKPMAIGIGKAIADQLGLSPEERGRLSRLLGRWTGRIAYLKALRNDGAVRHGIDGAPVEPVSREHALIARQQIYRVRLKRERRQAEQERQQARAVAAEATNRKLERERRANAGLPTLRLGGRP
jgi:sRNA-binding protein